VQIPPFPESNHPIVKSLFHHSDEELLTLFQHYPEQGKFFTAIFCRYTPIVYTLIRHSARSSPVQADYLFALTWRHIYYELASLDLHNDANTEAPSFQNWLINMTAISINQAELPGVESIHYSLQAAPPPLWCYIEQALEQLPPMLRFIVLMAQAFHWSETGIAAHLQAEGEALSPAEVRSHLIQGYQLLEAALPEDIRLIYLQNHSGDPETESEAGTVPSYFNP
jgi:DNA-directed RNA polymerase specialized sigma24 family protein